MKWQLPELEKDYLELSGFDVVMQHTGDAGLKAALNEDFNLIHFGSDASECGWF